MRRHVFIEMGKTFDRDSDVEVQPACDMPKPMNSSKEDDRGHN